MKKAVAWLNPHIEAEKLATGATGKAGKVVLATVKGDVHDIGKNIVSVIMRCNGYDVVDMGVMVPGEDIVNRVIAENADIVALSGLITPSLEEMRNVARLMQEKHLDIPLMVGGATTSELHTAVKIAPECDAPVVHTRDAAMMPVVAQQLLSNRDSFVAEWTARQAKLRDNYNKKTQLYTIDEARNRAPQLSYAPVAPQVEGVNTYGVSVTEARSYINWIPFYAAWKVSADSIEAKDLRADANKLLDELEQVANDSIKARIGVLPAYRNGEAIVVANERIEMLRQQTVNDSDVSLSLCDFVASADDYVGVFAVSVGSAINAMIQEANDEYRVMLLQTVADRLVEAATERVHARVRKELWGYASEENENPENLLRQYYQGVRPAVGYPSLPDQSVIFQLDRLLDLSEIDVSLTENGAMSPASSICGLMLAHPESRYFVIGEIGDDQRADYAQRKGFTKEEMNKFLK